MSPTTRRCFMMQAVAGTGAELATATAGAQPARLDKKDPQAVALGRHKHNVMPALVYGALANCTLGEMVQAMADVYGRYTGGPEW